MNTKETDCECGLTQEGVWSEELFDRYGCECDNMTIEFQEELPLNHEPSLNHWAKRQADRDVDTGYHNNWDYAYEQAWHGLDAEFNYSYI